jgi:hypothetical protein
LTARRNAGGKWAPLKIAHPEMIISTLPYSQPYSSNTTLPAHPFDDFNVVDSRLVTGTNPASAKKHKIEAVKPFDKLK